MRFISIFLVVAALILTFDGATSVAAPKYPEKPVTLIVPVAAGGATDQEARTIAEAAKAFFPQPVVVVNRPGGGGTVGAAEVIHSKPDGYTVAIVMNASLTVQPHVTNLPYKGPEDYKAVINLINLPFLIASKADAPWKSMNELLDYAKKNPGKVRVGHNGVGTISHIDLELLKEKAAVNMTKVPGAGEAETVQRVLGGHLEAGSMSPPSVIAQVRAGRLKVLAVFREKRHPLFPDAPTCRELGYDITLEAYHPIIVPKGTPDGVVKVLEDMFKKAMETDAFKKFTENVYYDLNYIGSADLKRKLEAEYAFYAEAAKKMNLKK